MAEVWRLEDAFKNKYTGADGLAIQNPRQRVHSTRFDAE